MKYGDKIIYMEGIIVKVMDRCVGIDLKGRLGYMKIPMRMLITDYPIKVGQEVGFHMSFIEQLGPEPNEKYISNQKKQMDKIQEIKAETDRRKRKEEIV